MTTKTDNQTATAAPEAPTNANCVHCGRSIIKQGGQWIDPEATCDDAQNNLDAWRRGRQTNDNPFRGVTLHKRSGKWQAQVQTKGAKGYLGLFDTREQAADIAAQKRRELSAQ